MKRWNTLWLGLAYFFAMPFLLWQLWRRGLRYWVVLQLAVTTTIRCYHCKAPIPLVGIWQCGCGVTYRGHVMRPCNICGKVPRIVRCRECRVTTQLM